MTKQGYTALVFVIDESGSMAPIAHEMEGAIEGLLAKQKSLPGELTVDMVYFDAPSARSWHQHNQFWNVHLTPPFPPAEGNPGYREVYHLADPANVHVEIVPKGGTALNDALGKKVTSFGAALAALPEDERPEQVIFAIVTDGGENSSRVYTGPQVKEMIEHQQARYGWNFVYFGANQDAIGVAAGYGIGASSTMTWNPAKSAVAGATMDSYITSTRTVGSYTFTDEERQANQ